MTEKDIGGTAQKSADELMAHLNEIERQVREARGEKVDRSPWDFAIPTGRDMKHMRETCGLSREELAEIIGYKTQTVYNVEAPGTDYAPGREYISKCLLAFKREWPR